MFKDIVVGSLIGAGVGGIIGLLAAPTIAGLLTAGGTIGGGMALAGVGGATVGGIAISTCGLLALSGAAAITAVASLGLTTMLSKGFGPRMGHNQYENAQFDKLCRKHHLTKDEARILHEEISHQNYDYHQIEEIIKELFGK